MTYIRDLPSIVVGVDIPRQVACSHKLAIRQCLFKLYIIAQCNIRFVNPIYSIYDVGKSSFVFAINDVWVQR